MAVLVDDRIGRAMRREDGVRVDEGDDAGDEHDPPERLEVAEEGEPDRRDAEELAEVLGRVPAGNVEGPRQNAQREADAEQAPPAPQRQHQPDQCETRRDENEGEERDVPPRRRGPQPIVEGVVEPERREED